MYRPLSSARVLHKIKEVYKPSPDEKYIINRNPRNLERLRIAYKRDGYHLEKPGRSFWHKLQITPSGRYVTAEVVHFENGPVISASTSEWAVKKHLYRTKDTSAYINLAKIFAQRCLESGIINMRCDVEGKPDEKIGKFLKVLSESGIQLSEAERYMPSRPWDMDRKEKPWEVTEKILE